MKIKFIFLILLIKFSCLTQVEIILDEKAAPTSVEKAFPPKEKLKLGILDTVQTTLDNLMLEMDSIFAVYSDKYPVKDLKFKSVTTYQHSSKGNYVEKSISDETSYLNYSINYFKNEKSVQLLYLFMNNVSLTTKKYDKNGILIELGEYRSDSKNVEKYSNESFKSKTGDTLITKFYTNDYLSQTTKAIQPEKNCSEIWHYTAKNDLHLKSKFCYSKNNKHLYSEFENFSYPYHTIHKSIYNSKGLLDSKVENRLHDSTTIVTNSYYIENQKVIKEVEYTNGTLTFTRLYSYDKNGNLVNELGIGKSGSSIYQCIYEYDTNNNKVVYLYYYY